jgi:superfamily I DNA/RNA helicase
MAQFEPTHEQKVIIEADAVPIAVVACPGSGKTTTAVRRLAELRRRSIASRGCVVLLSYSNVAVDTFRTEYQKLTGRAGEVDRVVIQTMDSFITTYLLRPHGARVMQCNRTPYLVFGSEPFMVSYAVGQGKERIGLEDVLLDRSADQTVFHRRFNGGGTQRLSEETQREVIDKAKKLAKVGGYTYALGRAWALRLLKKEPRLAAAVARRFPQILVDEAQDVGSFEGELLDLLGRSGSVVSLIGDAHQSIYGFNFATGAYLRKFALREGVLSLALSQNRRSIPAVVSLANVLAATDSKPFREKPDRLSGTYYWRYEKNKLPQFMSAWATAVKAANYDLGEVAVLCRGKSLLASVSSGVDEMGQSAVKHFAAAAVARERRGDIALTLEHCAKGVMLLLDGLADSFLQDLKALNREGGLIAMRRLVWALIRNPSTGIPSGTLDAKSQWLPTLKKNLADWLCLVESATSYRRVDTWMSRVTTTKLPDSRPLVAVDFGQNEWSGLRFGTVHSAKGEGIPAVMYLTSKPHLDALVAGTDAEDGRIGFVAATRARDLLVIAIPNSTAPEVIASLECLGLTEWGQGKFNVVLMGKDVCNL